MTLDNELNPIVNRPHYRFELKSERKDKKIGKGFSKLELDKVGLTFKSAKKLEIPIDKRRKTIYEENVEKLKKILEEKIKKKRI
jgi:large subunit ribosomal protein L13e